MQEAGFDTSATASSSIHQKLDLTSQQLFVPEALSLLCSRHLLLFKSVGFEIATTRDSRTQFKGVSPIFSVIKRSTEIRLYRGQANS